MIFCLLRSQQSLVQQRSLTNWRPYLTIITRNVALRLGFNMSGCPVYYTCDGVAGSMHVNMYLKYHRTSHMFNRVFPYHTKLAMLTFL